MPGYLGFRGDSKQIGRSLKRVRMPIFEDLKLGREEEREKGAIYTR
jgi:hypothetical protein